MKKLNNDKEFFLSDGKRRKEKHNKQCLKCVCDCKQSYRASIHFCPYYTPKQKANNGA